MKNEIKEILKKAANIYDIPASIGSLTLLCDQIEYGEWDEKTYKQTLNILLDTFFHNELKNEYRQALHRAINLLIGQNYFDLSDKDLFILFDILNNSKHPGFIDSAIYMLSLTFDPRHIPFIEKFLSHSEKIVRDSAEEAISDLKTRIIEA